VGRVQLRDPTWGTPPLGPQVRHVGGLLVVTNEIHCDRQLLVAGDGLAALTCAGFLDQGGFDPVLAPATRTTVTPDCEAVPIWRPGLELLAHVGLRRPVERLGTRLDARRTIRGARVAASDPADRPVLVTIRAGDLRDLLAARVRDRIRTKETAVTGLESTRAGVRAAFEPGISETFDAAVTTVPSLYPDASPSSGPTGLRAWSFEWPETLSGPDEPVESVDEGHAAMTTPVDDGVRVLLLGAEGSTPDTPVAVEQLEGVFGPLLADIGDPFDGLAQHDLQYWQSGRHLPRSMVTGSVGLLGPGVRASVPGDCLGASLAVEDAWVLADELAYGPSSAEAALASYQTRRRQRMAAVSSECHDRARNTGSHTRSPTLAALRGARSLAFDHVAGGLPAVARDIPGRL